MPCGRNLQDLTTISALGDNVNKELSPANFPSVKFWSRAKWTQHVQTEKSVTKLSSSTSMRGSSRLAKGENVACQYIEDADGVPVDGHRTKIICNVFFAYLHQLNQGNLKLPPGWLQVALDVKKTFYHTIRMNFSEFRYCSDNWKADFLATQSYSQWYKYHITNGKKRANADSSSSRSKKQKIEAILPEDAEFEYTMDVDSPTSSSTIPVESTIPIEPNTPSIPTTVPDSVSLDGLIDPMLKMISNHNSIDLSNAVTETTATDPAIPKPTHVNMPEVSSASIVPQTPLSSSSPPIPATPPIPVTPPIPATPSTSSIIAVTTSPRPVKAKTPAVPKDPNAPNKAKAMRIQKTINARNLCASVWKAAGNLLGTAKQFKVYWEQLPTADKAVFEV
ncbi:hypothetical protein DFJ58DRAFT_734009 [Suillus subalutaceus]|uniref:uncharacterized protein n=1 Tax=Suillus subalutaceus TaxID=48586 RepID=UPI001B85BD29|nr:uncharacterized protein DFJ58DRAFT_734009 [Suillus subalutaceus]KAG1838086.1 hypothetical protein DFJ58DRAFT_734009 [Suillus subalutaceus]